MSYWMALQDSRYS